MYAKEHGECFSCPTSTAIVTRGVAITEDNHTRKNRSPIEV